MKPYCFILMPFGRKTDESGKTVEFDKVYEYIIEPAVKEADLEPVRADEEILGGIIHKPMFERLMLCDYAVADLTTANANVFYELGVRHGVRPHSTLLTFTEGMRLPFDVAPLRALPYKLDSSGLPIEIDDTKKKIVERLEECREPSVDSPVFQLVSDMPSPDIARLKTDTFRDTVQYSNYYKEKLKEAREKNKEAVAEIEGELGRIVDIDPGITIDLFLSYRAVKDWESMINLAEKMSPMLRKSILVQEQLGFALNRLEKHKEAEKILEDIISKHGSSSETNGILGRVYKDLWEKNKQLGNDIKANGYLKKAINTYLEGFEADWRDAYPGINAVTLMEIKQPVDSRQKEILPVVLYAVKRRLSQKYPDYWDYATLLELNVLSNDKEEAYKTLSNALTEIREKWEPESTARNIKIIIDAREKRNEEVEWIKEIYSELIKASTNK
jgi:tetratricopeptide (TPR) repeat protein